MCNSRIVLLFLVNLILLTLIQCDKFNSAVEDLENVINNTEEWIAKFVQMLNDYTKAARRVEAEKHFKSYQVEEESWETVVEEIASGIRQMMQRKIQAVKAIKEHAELLSLNRKEPINTKSMYDYYDSGNLTSSNVTEDRSDDILQMEKLWRCSIRYNISCMRNQYSHVLSDDDETPYRCDHVAFIPRPVDYYRSMNMKYDSHFDGEVNTDYSIIRVTPNVDPRENETLNGIRWSEGLDPVFKCNYKKDPTLTWQYFGSPNGFIRFYPAMQWSEEEYDQTYDFRLRPWYIEGISSAKDIIILIDRSGSMRGHKRILSNHIVNSILDTLTDNDFVNIYTFTNTTEPLVDCFQDVLVQANEENLRLLREQLADIDNRFCGDISLGLDAAFPLLWKFRTARRGKIECNQAIMLISERIDYEYRDNIFKIYNHLPNEKYYRPIRLFTYLLGTEPMDAQKMKWIACANMGYFVNITAIEEVREKVLKYLEVLSRPINLSPLNVNTEPAWTALYVHLADRRLSNWLWKKYEGNKQRQMYIDYENEYMFKNNLTPQHKYFTLSEEHPHDIYLEQRKYTYLTSVSLPVRDLRPNATSIVGVAGVDVPLEYIKQLTTPHRIGVNGYPFIITNNGYVLDHPDHRKHFKDGILKPTFNRVDFTEVEISNDTHEPRIFDDKIIKLRERIVLQEKGNDTLSVRIPIDDMHRVMLGKRHYYYTNINPFSLVIALPKNYGTLIVNTSQDISTKMCQDIINKLKANRFWRIHPDWLYTPSVKQVSPEDKLKDYFNNQEIPDCNFKTRRDNLLYALIRDAKHTEWFQHDGNKYRYGLVLSFIATHAGLTRWRNHMAGPWEETHFANTSNRAQDEVYYRRSADENYSSPNIFVYSVPFEGYNENKTLITASNVIFLKAGGTKRAPVAAVGVQILHQILNNNLKEHPLCFNKTWTCYVLDSDGYVLLANNTKLIGKSISKVDENLSKVLIHDNIFKEITVFDYQATCYTNYTTDEKFYGPTVEEVQQPDLNCSTPVKCKTIEYLRRKLQKTTPTPCDEELKMLNLIPGTSNKLDITKGPPNCKCQYYAKYIAFSNLVFVMVNNTCCLKVKSHIIPEKYPKVIIYNNTLPCYIAKYNNFTKRHYTKCITKNEAEFTLNENNIHCGVEDQEFGIN